MACLTRGCCVTKQCGLPWASAPAVGLEAEHAGSNGEGQTLQDQTLVHLRTWPESVPIGCRVYECLLHRLYLVLSVCRRRDMAVDEHAWQAALAARPCCL